MPCLQFEEQLDIAKNDLKNGNYNNVGSNCGTILEEILKNLYSEIKTKTDTYLFQKLDKIENEIIKTSNLKPKDFTEFTIGQLAVLYRNGSLLRVAEESLNKNVKILQAADLFDIGSIRNKCVHSAKCKATPKESEYLYYTVKLIAEELGHVSKNKCHECQRFLSMDWNNCPYCGANLKYLCPECGYAVEEDFKRCPKCNEPLYILSKREIEILNDTKAFLAGMYEERKECPLCHKLPEICSVDGGDEDTGPIADYAYICNCSRTIYNILKCRCIKNSLKYKYLQFLDKETETSRPLEYYDDLYYLYNYNVS